MRTGCISPRETLKIVPYRIIVRAQSCELRPRSGPFWAWASPSVGEEPWDTGSFVEGGGWGQQLGGGYCRLCVIGGTFLSLAVPQFPHL